MGSYASVAVRDEKGNIVGYRSTSTGQITEGRAAPTTKVTTPNVIGEAAKADVRQISYDPDSAAGIALEVARTGGASDYYLNIKAEQQIREAGGDPSQIRYATNIYTERRELGGSYVPKRLDLTREEMAVLPVQFSPEERGRLLEYDQRTRMLERMGPSTQITVDTGIHKAVGDFGGPILEGGAYGGWKEGKTARERGVIGATRVETESRFSGTGPTVTRTGEALPRWEDYKGRFTERQQALIESAMSTTKEAARVSFEMQEQRRKDVTIKSTVEERQKIELPIIGEVPFASAFLPTKITTTYESGRKVETEGKTPFTTGVQERMPEAYTKESDKVIRGGLKVIGGLPLIGTATRPVEQMFAAEEAIKTREGSIALETAKRSIGITSPLLKPVTDIKSSDVSLASGFVPGTPEFMRDVYSGVREDPAKSLVASGLTLGIVGIGTGARMLGAGTKFAKPVITAEGAPLSTKIYSAGSQAVSAGMISLYGADVMERTTGLRPGDVSIAMFGAWRLKGQEPEYKGLAGLKQKFEERYPGIKETRRQLNIAATQELLPVAITYGGGMLAADKLAGWAQLRKTPMMSDVMVKARAFKASEGFPVSQEITTKALMQSFQAGTLVLESPTGLARTTMAPYGKPLTRVPVGTQIGVKDPAATVRVFSGSEVPYMQEGGMIATGPSEIQAAFVSPVGYSYFAKPGSGPFGFGITSDILGIYRQPTLHQITVARSDIRRIPESVLKTKDYMVDPLTGKVTRFGANDPMNPRNIAVSKFMAEQAEYGKVYVGHRGKAEWEGFIKPGTQIQTGETTAWFKDMGRRVRIQEVTLGGKMPGYEPPTQWEVGRFYAELGGTPSSAISSGKTPATLGAISAFKGPSRVSSKAVRTLSSDPYSVSKPSYPKISSPSSPRASSSPISPRGPSYPKPPSSSLPDSSGISSPFTSPESPPSTPPSVPYTPPYTPVYSPVSSPPSSPVATPPYTPPYTPSSSVTPSSRVPPPFGGGGYVSGGGGGGLFSRRSLIKWERLNPVADMPYLSRGMRSPAFANGFGSAFGSTTKKSGGRKSKFVRYRDRVPKRR